MIDCDTFRNTIDLWSAYFAFTPGPDRIPFLTPADVNYLDILGVTTIVETYHRVPGGSSNHNWKHKDIFRQDYAPLKRR
jgi:hypothetical protein